MMCVSCATVNALPSVFSAGTSGDTPPAPPMPWHWAHANWTKSCAPAATVLLTGVVLEPGAGDVRWMIVVALEALSRPTSQAVTATATMTRAIAATAIPTTPPPLGGLLPSCPLAIRATLAAPAGEGKRRNYGLSRGATSCIDAAVP